MKQVAVQNFESTCGKCKILVDNDMSLGALHDFLSSIKNHVVELILKNNENSKPEEKKESE